MKAVSVLGRFAAGLLLGMLLTGCAGKLGSGPADLATESDKSPDQKRALLRLELASAYFGNGQNEVALDEVKQSIALNPQSADAYSLRGLIYTRLGEVDLAEDSFKRALSIKPRAASIEHNYGVFLCQQGRWSESQKRFGNALAAPGYADRVKTWTTQGLCQRNAGALADARESLLRAFEIDPANPTVGYYLALLMAETGDWSRTQFYLRRLHGAGSLTPESLWLAIKAERRVGDANTLALLGTQLRTQFPKSPELQLYERKAFDE